MVILVILVIYPGYGEDVQLHSSAMPPPLQKEEFFFFLGFDRCLFICLSVYLFVLVFPPPPKKLQNTFKILLIEHRLFYFFSQCCNVLEVVGVYFITVFVPLACCRSFIIEKFVLIVYNRCEWLPEIM